MTALLAHPAQHEPGQGDGLGPVVPAHLDLDGDLIRTPTAAHQSFHDHRHGIDLPLQMAAAWPLPVSHTRPLSSISKATSMLFFSEQADAAEAVDSTMDDDDGMAVVVFAVVAYLTIAILGAACLFHTASGI